MTGEDVEVEVNEDEDDEDEYEENAIPRITQYPRRATASTVSQQNITNTRSSGLYGLFDLTCQERGAISAEGH